MAILHIQDGTVGNFTGSLTASCSLTPTAGNCVLLQIAHQSYDHSAPTFSVTDSINTYSPLFYIDSPGGGAQVACYYALNVLASSITTVVTALAGVASNSFGGITITEFSGVARSPVDQTTGASGNSVSPATGSTAALTGSTDLAICIFAASGSITGLTNPPVGTGTWIDILNSPTGAFGVTAYQILTGTTAVNANIGTMSNAFQWAAGVGTLQAGVILSNQPVPSWSKQTFVNETIIQY